MIDIEAEMRRYAGNAHAERREIETGTFDFFDYDIEDEGIDGLISALIAFKEAHAGERIELDFDRGWHDERAHALIAAFRQETDAELANRIAGVRQEVLLRVEARRAEYERMKREFGDA